MLLIFSYGKNVMSYMAAYIHSSSRLGIDFSLNLACLSSIDCLVTPLAIYLLGWSTSQSSGWFLLHYGWARSLVLTKSVLPSLWTNPSHLLVMQSIMLSFIGMGKCFDRCEFDLWRTSRSHDQIFSCSSFSRGFLWKYTIQVNKIWPSLFPH